MPFRKIALSSLAATLPERVNIFICSASFERRSTVIPASLAASHINHAIICVNKVAFTSKIDETAREICHMFNGRSHLAEMSLDDPLLIADRLQYELRRLPEYKATTYAIDITSFTHEALLILLRILHATVRPQDKVICLYNAASDYSVDEPPERKWLTKGVGEIRSVLGYPGKIIPTHKIHLLVLVGFETERAERIIAAYEPTVLSLGYGSQLQSIRAPFHSLNKQFHRTLSEKYTNVFEFTFSCEDALATKAAVETQARLFNGFNVVVAPMNTKISTAGVALAAFENEALQICYATAEQYNFLAYSAPSDDCYIFEMPLLTSATA